MSSTPATSSARECSIIVPVYGNAENIAALLVRLGELDRAIAGGVEAVFVVDGSPDRSAEMLADGLRSAPFPARLLVLSRNFGSFAAIREGLRAATGGYFAVMAADMQEPASFVTDALAALRGGDFDIALGTRTARSDPLASRLASTMFWSAYRRFVQSELPRGGIDVFACNAAFRNHLVAFSESHSSLVGQLLWLGFRRKEIPYVRHAREHGSSAWGLARKIRYLLDSVYSFSDLPIRFFVGLGTLGIVTSIAMGLAVLVSRLTGAIDVPGYAATVIIIVFFAGLNLLGLGIIGSYVWRAYENTKARPLAVVMRECSFDPANGPIRK